MSSCVRYSFVKIQLCKYSWVKYSCCDNVKVYEPSATCNSCSLWLLEGTSYQYLLCKWMLSQLWVKFECCLSSQLTERRVWSGADLRHLKQEEFIMCGMLEQPPVCSVLKRRAYFILQIQISNVYNVRVPQWTTVNILLLILPAAPFMLYIATSLCVCGIPKRRAYMYCILQRSTCTKMSNSEPSITYPPHSTICTIY